MQIHIYAQIKTPRVFRVHRIIQTSMEKIIKKKQYSKKTSYGINGIVFDMNNCEMEIQ
jgi:hypothetical protein